MTASSSGTEDTAPRLRIDCSECYFRKTVPAGGAAPADIVVDHGKETGHKLSISQVEE